MPATPAAAPAPVVADTTAKAAAAPEGQATPPAAAPAAPVAPAAPAAPAETAAVAQEETAKDAIIENPLEFGIVSAVFLATVLVIIFTGKD
jgi:hypothetical protein